MSHLAQQVARALLAIDAVGFTTQQPVTFKSGIMAPVYVDNRRLPYHPHEWRVVIEGFHTLLAKAQLPYEVIAGVAVGGVPHSAALGYLLHKPSIFIRPEAKEHGARRRIEGGDVAGRHVLLIEDLVTTGGSSLEAVAALRADHAFVTDVAAIVSYGFAETISAFATAGVRLHTLTQFSVILDETLQQGRLKTAEAAIVRDWFADPKGWAARQGLA